MTAVVVSLTAAREQRLEALRREVAECFKAVARCRGTSSQYDMCQMQLDGALERLSIAEGMPRRL
jgi:hypothetical protein